MEEDYQKLIEYSHDIIFRLSPDGIFQYVSPACIALLGYPAGQLIGQPFSKIVHPDSAPLCDTDFREVLKTGQKREGVEYKVRHSDGSWYWHRASLAALHDESGQISGIVGVARDITERNKLIDELKNQKEQFELAIRGSSDGIWVWNILTNELYLSPKLKEQLGYGENELPNTIKAYKKLIHPDVIKNFNKTIRHHVRNSSQLISVEYRILHKNGNYKWIWARGAALRDLNGKVCRIAGSHTDITEKKESDRIIREREYYLRTILEATQDGFAVTGSGGYIADVNQTYCQMTGYTKEELNRLTMEDILICEDPPDTRAHIDKAIKSGTELFESRLMKKNGSYIDVEVSLTCKGSDRNTIVSFVRDITDRKKMERMLNNEKEMFRTTLLSVGDAVISTDEHCNVIVMNPIAEKLTGWTSGQASGLPLGEVFKLVNEKTRKTVENPGMRAMETGKIIELSNHTLLISKSGREIPIEDSAAPIKDSEGRITGSVIVFRDYTEKKEKQNQIEYLSFNDPLTGLYNRRYMEDSIKRLDTPRNFPLTVMIIDVNGLKLTNDAFGHEMGDKLLKTVARIIRKVCRATDIIGRMGGDEFYILLTQTNEEQAKLIKHRIMDSAENAKLDSVIVSLAVGYAVKTHEAQDIKGIMTTADNHMYKDKIKYGRIMRSQTIEAVLHNININYDQEQIHTQRVSQYCEAIAKAMDLRQKEIQDIKAAGVLHDIGKIMIPPQLLQKPEKLTTEEYEMIKRHPEIGYQMLKSVDEYVNISEYVLYHHEKWDGSGYPEGLAGEHIPLYSRIIAIADAYEAMTAKRAYQKSKTAAEACAELKKYAGIQFDPDIVTVFVEKVLKQKI